MSAFNRRTFVQTAALGSVLTSVLGASSVEAAGPAGYFVIAEVVAKPGSASLSAGPVRRKISNRTGLPGLYPS
jgi:hypothetical protein